MIMKIYVHESKHIFCFADVASRRAYKYITINMTKIKSYTSWPVLYKRKHPVPYLQKQETTFLQILRDNFANKVLNTSIK